MLLKALSPSLPILLVLACAAVLSTSLVTTGQLALLEESWDNRITRKKALSLASVEMSVREQFTAVLFGSVMVVCVYVSDSAKEKLQRHCEEVYENVEETIKVQEYGINTCKSDGDGYFTEERRVAEILC